MTSVDDVWTRPVRPGVSAGISTPSARSFVHVTMIIFDMPGKHGIWPKRLREEHP